MLSCETIRNRLEEADRYMTDDPFSAIYALRDGSLVSGNYNGGVRCEDHNCMNAVIDTDYYDRQFWHDVFSETGVLMLIPETMQIAFPN